MYSRVAYWAIKKSSIETVQKEIMTRAGIGILMLDNLLTELDIYWYLLVHLDMVANQGLCPLGTRIACGLAGNPYIANLANGI